MFRKILTAPHKMVFTIIDKLPISSTNGIYVGFLLLNRSNIFELKPPKNQYIYESIFS